MNSSSYCPFKADIYAVGRVALTMMFGLAGLASNPNAIPRCPHGIWHPNAIFLATVPMPSPEMAEFMDRSSCNEEQRWNAEQTISSQLFQRLSRQVSSRYSDSKITNNTKVASAKEYEWHVLDLSGHEYPNPNEGFRARYDVSHSQKPSR